MIPLAAPGAEIFGPVSLVLAALIGAWGARQAYRANKEKNRQDADNNAGQLALSLAKDLRVELTAAQEEIKQLRKFRLDIRLAWRQHNDWDEQLLEHVDRIDPGARKLLGDPPEMPVD